MTEGPPTATPAPARGVPGWAIAVGAIGGFAAGWLVGPPMREVAIVGEMFLLALRMVIVPLVVASLVTGVASLRGAGLGRAARVMVVYGLATMLVATAIGLALVTTLRPGVGASLEGAPAAGELPQTVRTHAAGGTWEAIQEVLRSFLSPNVFAAMSGDPPGILAVIVFSLAFGALLAAAGPVGRPVLAVFEGIDEVLQRMIRLVVWAAPVGVFALIAARIGKAGGGDAALRQAQALGLYMVTVISGLLVQGFVVLPAVLRVFGGRPPWRYARGMSPALFTAFSTASSSATMPVTIDCLTRANRVGQAAVRFVVPLGATLNMNGTALYEAVAAVFIAQAYGVALGPVQLVLVAVTATLAAIGASAVPEAGLVTMVIVLQTVGLPIEGIGLILAVDWFLDRCRTTVNVWDDGVGSAVVERHAGLARTLAPATSAVGGR